MEPGCGEDRSRALQVTSSGQQSSCDSSHRDQCPDHGSRGASTSGCECIAEAGSNELFESPPSASNFHIGTAPPSPHRSVSPPPRKGFFELEPGSAEFAKWFLPRGGLSSVEAIIPKPKEHNTPFEQELSIAAAEPATSEPATLEPVAEEQGATELAAQSSAELDDQDPAEPAAREPDEAEASGDEPEGGKTNPADGEPATATEGDGDEYEDFEDIWPHHEVLHRVRVDPIEHVVRVITEEVQEAAALVAPRVKRPRRPNPKRYYSLPRTAAFQRGADGRLPAFTEEMRGEYREKAVEEWLYDNDGRGITDWTEFESVGIWPYPHDAPEDEEEEEEEEWSQNEPPPESGWHAESAWPAESDERWL